MFVVVYLFLFCFKHKTAYEMRISDWSSDVCSSDLGRLVGRDVDRARGRVLAIKRSLRPAQHFDLRDVEEVEGGGGDARIIDVIDIDEIGRASCRERVCQYV